MIFSTGSTFIFGSWICEADDNGKLQGCLLEDSDHHEDLAISATMANQITRKLARLVMSDPTRISRPTVFHAGLQNASSTYQEFNSESIHSSFKNSPSSFPTGLWNTASAYQEYNSKYIQSSLKKSGHGTTTSSSPSQGQASCPAASRAGRKPVV